MAMAEVSIDGEPMVGVLQELFAGGGSDFVFVREDDLAKTGSKFTM